jgi:hypothetical protein
MTVLTSWKFEEIITDSDQLGAEYSVCFLTERVKCSLDYLHFTLH